MFDIIIPIITVITGVLVFSVFIVGIGTIFRINKIFK